MNAFLTFLALLFFFVSCEKTDDFFARKGGARPSKQIEKLMNFDDKYGEAPEENSNLLNWMRYPAISPDGSEIAFAFMGDIFIVSSNGGFARPLTSSSSFESNPVWSNDGKRVAFSSDRFGNRDIFIVSKEGGASQRLTFHSANDIPMAFSPDDLKIYFSSPRMGSKESSLFPSRSLPQLYSVSIDGKNEIRELPFPVLDLKINSEGTKFIYTDKKGYENEWRKGHISSSARDIWEYDLESKKFNKITDFPGEDRNAVFGEEGEIYYLSEEGGSFNVWRRDADGKKTQITKFDVHPVRFLSRSNSGVCAFSYNGQIYTMKKGGKAEKLEIFSTIEASEKEEREMISAVTEIAANGDGSEVAVILHGEIYVVNMETGTTARITETPNEERWVSFHPEGRKLLYSSFRNGSWNIYETALEDENEPYFSLASKMSEREIISNDFNAFQARYSPDGKKISYLKERTELVVYDMERNLSKTVLSGDRNVSYIDGDQQYSWSPDSSKIAVIFNDRDRWSGELGIVNANGEGEVVNITNSGAFDSNPKWSGNGEFISWISEGELFAFFLNKKGYDNFLMSKEEFDLEKKGEAKREEKRREEGKNNLETEKANGNLKRPKIVEFEAKDFDSRIIKTSLNPADYVEHAVSNDGETLYFMTVGPAEFKVVALALREKEEKVLATLPHPRNLFFWDAPDYFMDLDKKGDSLFVLANAKARQIAVADGKIKEIKPAAEFSVNKNAEYSYLFEYVWKTVNDKFYEKRMHGVDWQKYKKEYEPFIPYINNDYDFSELLSEMLGELNASHTGSGLKASSPLGDSTGRLGIFTSMEKRGLKIDEIIAGGPLDKAESKAKAGVIIEKINGKGLFSDNFDKMLNKSAGKRTRISFIDPVASSRWDEIVRPISCREEMELLYKRWVKTNAKRVEKLSNGRFGYVHIRGMDEESFEEIYNQIMGKYNDLDGIVIDTRFNGGGWLHNELSLFFSGETYTRFSHRGVKNFGGDPDDRWTKKSVLLVNEGNYSDAHLFPFAYRALKLGKIVGAPVAGTATAVWWPSLLNEAIYFGIPQIGISGMDGKYLENNELIPDFVVPTLPEHIINGEDPQIEKAVQVLQEEK